jgi:hypothetical protein
MKKIKEYLIHFFTHNWVYDCGEGPFRQYKCDKCNRIKITQCHY